ncbi:hypothetical protein PIB30_040190 [Stylosanthes scabra]|uniref:RNase H type-1 domain-containing protein n=1 Tax=Stylosanthes scabra TaxID=79078 RepID=A0ABU6ZD84_9FABA|nr:hypothetical protein [Stylosanthes scabra]
MSHANDTPIEKESQCRTQCTKHFLILGKELLDQTGYSARRLQRRATWHPSPNGRTKLNVDVVFSYSSCKSASAVIIRESEGSLLTTSCSLGVCSSPLAAEALAMREALIIAKILQIDNAIFESDCANLIQAIK